MGRHARKLVDEFIAELADVNYSPHTMRAYRRWINDYLAHLQLRHRSLLSATHADVVSWRRSIVGKHATVRLALSAVRSFHGYLHATNVCPIDPTRAVRSPRRGDDEHVRITHSEAAIDALHDAVVDPFDGALLALLYHCALRISEAATLPRAYLRVADEQLTVIGKGRKRRDLWIPPRACELLTWHLRSAPESFYVLPARGRSTTPHVSVVTIDRRLHALAAHAGLDSAAFNPHSLRHARAEHLRASGVDVVWTSALLGHEGVSMTAHYMNPPTHQPPAA